MAKEPQGIRRTRSASIDAARQDLCWAVAHARSMPETDRAEYVTPYAIAHARLLAPMYIRQRGAGEEDEIASHLAERAWKAVNTIDWRYDDGHILAYLHQQISYAGYDAGRAADPLGRRSRKAHKVLDAMVEERWRTERTTAISSAERDRLATTAAPGAAFATRMNVLSGSPVEEVDPSYLCAASQTSSPATSFEQRCWRSAVHDAISRIPDPAIRKEVAIALDPMAISSPHVSAAAAAWLAENLPKSTVVRLAELWRDSEAI